jgi:hypothetical protein
LVRVFAARDDEDRFLSVVGEVRFDRPFVAASAGDQHQGGEGQQFLCSHAPEHGGLKNDSQVGISDVAALMRS